MLWRFSPTFYPDELLRALDHPGRAEPCASDEVSVEFSDGVIASGQLLQAEPNAAVLHLPAHCTQRKATEAEQTWRVSRLPV